MDINYIMYCGFCSDYISLLTPNKFCDDCATLRRVMLINERKEFLEHIKKEFIKYSSKKESKNIQSLIQSKKKSNGD